MANQQVIDLGRTKNQDKFSLGRVMGPMVFVSGNGPIENGQVKGETIEDQTRLTLNNITRILNEADCTLNDCMKVNVYLADLQDYDAFNRAYTEFFDKPLPTRTTVQCGLNFGIKIEIDAIAMKSEA